MPARKFFRIGDKVAVHGFALADGETVQGRVICTNRKSKYNMPIVVLADIGGSEMVEFFGPDGSRYLTRQDITAGCHITLGWSP